MTLNIMYAHSLDECLGVLHPELFKNCNYYFFHTASPKISGKLQKIFLINIKAAGYSLRGISLFLALQSVVKFVAPYCHSYIRMILTH